MIERGERLRLAFQARDTIRVGGKDVGQDLDRDVTMELDVSAAVDLAHASGTKQGCDLVGTEAHTWRQRHSAWIIGYVPSAVELQRRLSDLLRHVREVT